MRGQPQQEIPEGDKRSALEALAAQPYAEATPRRLDQGDGNQHRFYSDAQQLLKPSRADHQCHGEYANSPRYPPSDHL